MRILDPGHFYEMSLLDGRAKQLLRYVKRIGPKFPGNEGVAYPGVNMQEVLRTQIDRIKYLDKQEHHDFNDMILKHWRASLFLLDLRAAERHGRKEAYLRLVLAPHSPDIEDQPFCTKCGHIGCDEMSFAKQVVCDFCGNTITTNRGDSVPEDWITLTFETTKPDMHSVFAIHACENCAPTLMPTKVLTAWNPPPVKKEERGTITKKHPKAKEKFTRGAGRTAT